jgi:hypothetical protein
MPQQRIFPFRRVSVDHMVRGTSRVWWQLEALFNEPGPYVFQLQYGHTGLRDTTDWRNIGAPVTNGYAAYDPEWHAGGYDLLGHYRVKLTTPTNTYISQAANCFGELGERDWLLAREIVRKEDLRHRIASVAGYLIKPYRFGRACQRCRDPLTQEITDADCPVCNGTGFEVGYHPPLPVQFWDLSNEIVAEDVDAQLKGSTRENAYVTARALGFPALQKNDIWVNGASDERWRVESLQVAAALRGVPLVYEVKMGLVPFNNAIYALEVGGEPDDRQGPVLPALGCEKNAIDHNYGGSDGLAYVTSSGLPVVGADVYLFTKSVFDVAGVNTAKTLALFKTATRANGRWAESFNIADGEYVVLYEKLGEYGPDTQTVTITPVMSSTAKAPKVIATTPTAPAKPPRPTFKPDAQQQAEKNDFWNI